MLKMNPSFVVRMIVWSSLALYLVCDFFWLEGPLKRELRKQFPSKQEQHQNAVTQGICAKIYNQPIYISQVDRRVREKLYRTGRTPDSVKNKEYQWLRWAVIDELIAEHLLRIKTEANRETAPISEPMIDAEVKRFEKRFSSAEELEAALKQQGIANHKELRYRMAARLQQEKYLFTKISKSTSVSEDEARSWYQQHGETMKMPERRKVRHIFIATLDTPSEQAETTLTELLTRLQSGSDDFASLAATHSEDARNKTHGGELGWVQSERLPKDFAVPVFDLPLNTPSLIRTKLGWHIVEVTGIKAPEQLPFEQLKPEITQALTDSRKTEAIRQYKHQLRLLNHPKVEIFAEVLNAPRKSNKQTAEPNQSAPQAPPKAPASPQP